MGSGWERLGVDGSIVAQMHFGIADCPFGFTVDAMPCAMDVLLFLLRPGSAGLRALAACRNAFSPEECPDAREGHWCRAFTDAAARVTPLAAVA